MRPRRLLMSGGSGFLGSALGSALESQGWEVTRLVRRPRRTDREIEWDPETSRTPSAPELEGHDAAIHLSGATIGTRWTAGIKARIWQSRVDSTRILAEMLAGLTQRPATLISVSGIGIYGNRGEELLDETSEPGNGFLARLAVAWEGATAPASAAGIRVVHPRLGVVIGPGGGVIGQMLPPFRFGLGGWIGDGSAWWSWISLEDLVAGFELALRTTTLSGPVNFVSPEPVRSADFARSLGRALGRPAVLRVPAGVVRPFLGGMTDEVLLASAFVHPARLLASGFEFIHPRLDEALAAALDRAA